MIDTRKMPSTFGLCMVRETECPLAATCLRSLVFQQLERSKERRFVCAVNPYCTDSHYATNQCVAYASNQKIRYARGMKHLLDEVKKSDLQSVRLRVMGCFSCESYFYRSQKGTRLIKPEEQKKIARVFKSMNLGIEPKFDSYIEDYEWP